MRSWEDRVRGASQKVAIAPTAADDATETDGPTGTDVERGDDLLTGALTLAVDTLGVPLAVVERTSGRVRWVSMEWTERFGHHDVLSRHLPSTTELGETPLPPPGEAWRRTRSMLLTNGSEDLFDLLLSGARTTEGTEYVSVVAMDRTGPGAVISDRSEVTETIEGAMAESSGRSLAVLFVDMDRFKVVHDLVGQAEAVRLLDRVWRRIGGAVRATDLFFRLHSDEFVVVSCELEREAAAEELAERIREAVAVTDSDSVGVALTASVGVAIAEPDMTGEELLSAAETAVFLAKGRGRNRVAVHDEELRIRNQRMLAVEKHLRNAIERREVRFLYQPIVDLGSGQVVGGEALLRLGGEVGLSAIEVVNAAEHSGLMGDLGALVIDGVASQLGPWLAEDAGRHAMINLSAVQMDDDRVVDALMRAVDELGLAPGQLAVEIPAPVIVENPAAAARLASRVRPAVAVGIDGTGALGSATEELAFQQIDYVKLHRSLTGSVLIDDRARERVRWMVAEAVSHDRTVIGLGVEREAQAQALAALGCHRAQGFHYAGAVDSATLIDWSVSGLQKGRVTAEA